MDSHVLLRQIQGMPDTPSNLCSEDQIAFFRGQAQRHSWQPREVQERVYNLRSRFPEYEVSEIVHRGLFGQKIAVLICADFRGLGLCITTYREGATYRIFSQQIHTFLKISCFSLV